MKALPIEEVQKLIHPDDLPKIESTFVESAFDNIDATYQVEYRFKHKTGQYRWFHDQFVILKDQTCRPMALIGSVRDITDRKQAEEKLIDANWRFESIIDATRVGTWEWNVQTGETIFNEKWAQMIGYSLDELAPVSIKTWKNLAHPDDLYRSTEMLERHFSGEFPFYEFECRMRHKDGQWVWVHDCGRVITRTADGKPLMMFGTHTDITERKFADDALRESKERFDQLAEQNRTFIWEVDAKGIYTYVSHVSTAVIGYRPEELMGLMHFYDMHPETGRKEFKESALDTFVRKESFLNMENPIQTKDRGIVWVATNGMPMLNSDGTLIGYRGSDTDITDRKLVEIALQESELQFRLLFESASDALFLIDAKTGMILKANCMASELYGYEPAELLTKRSMDMSAEPEETLRLTREAHSASDQVLNIPHRLHRKKDGTVFPVEIVSRSFPLKGQKVLLVASRDITAREQAEAKKAELDIINRQLQKAESLNRMAGAIAHNFNNQLSAVIGNMELLMEDMPLGSDNYNILTDAMSASHKAADISMMMLTYLGQSPGKKEAQDLSETCHKGLLMIQGTIPKNVSVITEIPFPGPAVNLNTKQLFQIITHLITNAQEAITNHGTITVAIKMVIATDIPISNRFPANWHPKETSYACLEIMDSGCGIPKENIEKIFDPFFTTKFIGRGLGLSVVLGIITAHGGTITVENNTGGGCAFRVYLPLAPQTETVVTEKITIGAEVQAGGVVLLIDDQEQVRKMAGMMLSRQGYSVLEAGDGVEAVEIFQQNKDKICLVITDLTMPRMNGWETLAALRKISPDIPVILSSGYDEAHVMTEDHKDVPDAFLGKPYRKQDLCETISRVLAAKNNAAA